MTAKKKFSPEYVNAIIDVAFSEAALTAINHLENILAFNILVVLLG